MRRKRALEIIAGDPPVLQASYHPESFGIQYLTEPNAVRLVFQNLGFVLPAVGEVISSWAESKSAQNTDPQSGLTAIVFADQERQ